MRFFFRTLGCKMNWLDSARLSAALRAVGHEAVSSEEEADTVFINSCTVTSRADRQSRQEASRAERQEKQVVVFGCAPKVDLEEWKKKFPNLLIFSDDEKLLRHFEISEDDIDLPDFETRTRIPIAIQTGCDNQCTFCITRIARGKTKDFLQKDIVKQIRNCRMAGVQEVVLTGIQLASYGCGDSEKYPKKTKLPELLNAILEETTIPRIRMSSLGPQFLVNPGVNSGVKKKDFFEVFADPRICDHLHLSVQSGSDPVLEKMNRGHSTKEIREIAKRAREVRPDVAITADFIAGFPGETDEQHKETLKFVEEIGFAKLHVFPFSPRKGTAADNFPDQVPADVKKARAKELRDLGAKLRKDFCERQIGKEVEVLVEDEMQGFSKNYVRVSVPESRSGKVYPTVITKENLVDDFEK